MPIDQLQLRAIREHSHPLTGSEADYAPLMELIGNSRFVLIGEASHGTHEFYHTRAEITKRLIQQKGFTAVAVEADWPDAYRVNRYVQGRGEDQYAVQALEDFRRFPAWMWRNSDVLEFVTWLREYNDSFLKGGRKTGFYGMDLYSFHSSAHAVLEYLDKVDPEAAQRARYRYSCFEQFGEDIQAYRYAASFGLSKSCEDEVVNQLLAEMIRRAADLANRDGQLDPDEFFNAQQNARVVKNAERYYRAMFSDRISSWNLRDQHMAETLDQLIAHLGPSSKIVVWAHNSHLGDARATQMGEQGELNVGQLVREKYGSAVLIGFTTYTGTVTAASNWDGPAEQKRVRPALSDSFEAMFHATHIPQFLIILKGQKFLSGILNQPRLERAIGVLYLPQSERVSHYFHARLADQFDALIHLDETRTLQPLEITSEWERGEVPETYPHAV